MTIRGFIFPTSYPFYLLISKFIEILFVIIKIKNKLLGFLEKENKVVEKEIFNSESALTKAKSIKPNIKPINRPKVPSLSIPRFSVPSFELLLPYYPPFPTMPHRHKRRGRPPLPLKIPKTAKFKYLVIGTAMSFLFLFLPLYGYTFIKSLPDPRTLANQETAQTTKIYDRNKVLLYQIYANQNRTDVPLSKIPNDLINATIAIEDKNFYKTIGFDVEGIARSAVADIKGQPLQGGSTITQQLIKTRLLTPERTFERKIKEIILRDDTFLQNYFL